MIQSYVNWLQSYKIIFKEVLIRQTLTRYSAHFPLKWIKMPCMSSETKSALKNEHMFIKTPFRHMNILASLSCSGKRTSSLKTKRQSRARAGGKRQSRAHDHLCSVADKIQWFAVRMINSKCPYVGHGLRVRRRRTASPLTTYFPLSVRYVPHPYEHSWLETAYDPSCDPLYDPFSRRVTCLSPHKH